MNVIDCTKQKRFLVLNFKTVSFTTYFLERLRKYFAKWQLSRKFILAKYPFKPIRESLYARNFKISRKFVFAKVCQPKVIKFPDCRSCFEGVRRMLSIRVLEFVFKDHFIQG